MVVAVARVLGVDGVSMRSERVLCDAVVEGSAGANSNIATEERDGLLLYHIPFVRYFVGRNVTDVRTWSKAGAAGLFRLICLRDGLSTRTLWLAMRRKIGVSQKKKDG